MEQIQFAVSAKTARLIGRENISGVDGAVVELIKNSYDADATCVFVQFRIPFPEIPQTISFELASSVFDDKGLEKLLKYYENDGKRFSKREDLTPDDSQELNDYLFSYNTIVVMDNGCGMNETTLRTAWMNRGI